MERIYEQIARRTGGDVYIGVVGPVRTGKSTFIKRFMESSVIPSIDNVYKKERARDELPQSGSGRTIMTAEPKFIPEEAAEISLEGGGMCKVRMVDCVGYMVNGALGQFEDDEPRMVNTPWNENPIPMMQAAELGTERVIRDHATIGIVITTDGSITEIPRQDYIEAENRVIEELKFYQKPFVVIVNSTNPNGEPAQELTRELEERHGVPCIPMNCLESDANDISVLIGTLLYEFPIHDVSVKMPRWILALPAEHETKAGLYAAFRSIFGEAHKMADLKNAIAQLREVESLSGVEIVEMNMGSGQTFLHLIPQEELFYQIIREQTGLPISDEADLMSELTRLSTVDREYRRLEGALSQVQQTGYGIVMPLQSELMLEEPEIVRQGGRFGVRLKASAPSIHMIRADIKTEVSPIVGSEKQSEELVHYLLSDFNDNPEKIWESNIFGKSLHELVSEGLNNKLNRMPRAAREKLQETLQKIINEGSGGLICIIL